MRDALLSLLACAALLSGCAGKAGPDAPEEPAVGVITDPLDYSDLQPGAPGSHIHDYWQGRTEVTVLAEERGGLQASCGGCEDGMAVVSAVPEDGVIVPQGTRWVNGTFTAQPTEAQYERLELWVRTAQESEPRMRAVLPADGSFSIESTRDDNDPPHYVLSLWMFQVRAVGGEEVRFSADAMALDATAVRGLPLEPYPPHPDLWGGLEQLPLVDHTQAVGYVAQVQSPTGSTSTFCSGCPGTVRLPDSVVVPYETGEVVVRLEFSPGGMPRGLGVSFHGSDTRALTPLVAEPVDPAAPLIITYRIPIEAGMADSPYARQSLWEFRVWMDYPEEVPVQAWTGLYEMSATAYKA